MPNDQSKQSMEDISTIHESRPSEKNVKKKTKMEDSLTCMTVLSYLKAFRVLFKGTQKPL